MTIKASISVCLSSRIVADGNRAHTVNWDLPDDMPQDHLGEMLVTAYQKSYELWPNARPEDLTTVICLGAAS